MAVEHLVESGYKRVAMVSYAMRLSNICDREKGYESTMERLGLKDRMQIYRIDFHETARRVDDLVFNGPTARWTPCCSQPTVWPWRGLRR